MPNWCHNTVTFKHKDPKVIAKIVRGYNEGGLMSKFYPCPKELKDTLAGSFGAGTSEAKNHEIQLKLNVEKYGYKDWYEWQCANWSTKWDVGRDEHALGKIKLRKNATEVTLSFDSAWSPPVSFYEKMYYDQNVEITALYWEPGCGFLGRWCNGEDETYSYSDCATSKEAKEYLLEAVPADVVEAFGVLDWLDDCAGDEEETEEVAH